MREMLPPDKRRVKVHGRVDPKTYRRLMVFKGKNLGRKLDTALLHADAMRIATEAVSGSGGAEFLPGPALDEDAAARDEKIQA